MSAVECIFDHKSFCIVYKPEGVAVHAHESETLLDRVRTHFNSLEIHPCHRLDLATSGLMIFAKTAEANQYFSNAFANQTIQKIYLALTTDKPQKKQGWVIGDMAKSRGGSYKLLRTKRNPAKTYGLSFGCPQRPRLWLLRPTTGKTHQLRVALKSLSASILGDERYGGDKADRMYLHAYALRFSFQGEHFQFCQAPSSGHFFHEASLELEQLGDPWEQAWPASSFLSNPSEAISSAVNSITGAV